MQATIPEDDATPAQGAPGECKARGGAGSQHSSGAEAAVLRHARVSAGGPRKEGSGSSAAPTITEVALLDGVSAKAQGGRPSSSAAPRSLDLLDVKARRRPDGEDPQHSRDIAVPARPLPLPDTA